MCISCAEIRVRDRVEELALEVWRREVDELVRFFRELVDHDPWSLQRHWIKRLVSGESFAMIAPTGIGKSTLLAVYALYRALVYGWKVYILTPTREIAKQFYERILCYLEKLRTRGYLIEEVRLLFYDSASRNAKSLKEAILRGDFDILITSASFLSRNYDLISVHRIDLVIADDLDALMRNSKNVERILKLLGFDDEDIELATRLVKLRQNLSIAKLTMASDRVEELRTEVLELEAQLKNRICRRRSQLVVASATGRVKGLKSLVLRELLGFEGGALFEYWRNVVDIYAPLEELESALPTIVRKLGSGIVFVAPGSGKELVEKVCRVLENNGIRVAVAKSGTRAVDKFRRGELDVLIGTASYYGVIVRGFDEPLRVRFTVFVGVPRIVKDLKSSLYNIRFLYSVLRELKKQGVDVDDLISKVVEVIERSTPAMLAAYSKWLREPSSAPEQLKDRIELLLNIIDTTYAKLLEILKLRKKITINGFALIVIENGKALVLKPDPYTYIQASGRSSRLLNGSKTFGVSIVFEEHAELIAMLETRLRRFITGLEFRPYNQSELDLYAKRIETSRQGVGGHDIRRFIETALIIVESPTKAKTIASMFGKPARRSVGETIVYETVIPVDEVRVYVASIAASLGHIVDLVTDEGVYGVRIENGKYIPIYDFITKCRSCGSQHVGVYDTCPYCGSGNVYQSFRTFNALKKLSLDADRVLIGTDPDTEGEKIAFDLATLLMPYNRNIKRIEFHEVTRRAIIEALKKPRDINVMRVAAQIARRVADRWIGFEVSMWLQRTLNRPWLGAGRVQSPVLLWVVDRYREYRNSIGYSIVLTIKGYRIKVFIGKDPEHRKVAEELAESIQRIGVEVLELSEESKEISPPPPFTTDELLYEAGRVLGLSASRTMSIAQALFEAGLITYHRTDSTRVSGVGMAIAREALEKRGLGHLYTPRSWVLEDKRAEDAHEAIRPTMPLDAEEVREAIVRGDLGVVTRIGDLHLRVYDLIFRRFLASQMRSSRIRFVKARLRIGPYVVELEAPTSIETPGFASIYPPKLYPELAEALRKRYVIPDSVKVVRSAQIRLYTSADLVKMLKDRGIGRPSTYAKAIDNNVRHGYIVLSKKRKAAIPTKLGIAISEVIRNLFLDLVGEHVTRELEESMDDIEMGRKSLYEFLAELERRIDKIMHVAETKPLESLLTDLGVAV